MRAARSLALALLLLPLAAPPAQACSWALPGGFDEVHWVQPDAVLTQAGYVAVRAPLGGGPPAPLADLFPRTDLAPGPAGAFAWSHGGDDPDPARQRDGAACGLPLGATLVQDAAGGRTVLLDGGARALAAGQGTLAVAHAMHGLLAYAWGAWDAPRPLRAGGLDPAQVWDLAVSSDGALVAAADRGDGTGAIEVVLFRATGEALGGPLRVGQGQPQVRLAFSPDGRWLAVGLSPGDRGGRVVVHDLHAPGFPRVAERADAEGLVGLAWGPRGLAASYTAFAADRDPVPARSAVRLFAPGANLTLAREVLLGEPLLGRGLAWSPDGAHLAAGGHGHLRILDAELREVRSLAMPGQVGEPPPREDPGPPVGRPPPQAVPGVSIVGVGLAVAVLAIAASRREGRR